VEQTVGSAALKGQPIEVTRWVLVGTRHDSGDPPAGTPARPGGMGAVFLAYHTRLYRQVAVKRLAATPPTPHRAPDSCARPQCRRIESSAHLHDPRGWRIRWDPFIAMEYVAGRFLRERIDEGALAMSEAAAQDDGDEFDVPGASGTVSCCSRARVESQYPAGSCHPTKRRVMSTSAVRRSGVVRQQGLVACIQ